MRLRLLISLACLAGDSASALASDWAVPSNVYRIAVTVDSESSRRIQCPVGVEIDFKKLFEDAAIPGRVDRNSIRVMLGDQEAPHQLTGDFANDSAGRIWWRIADGNATRWHIYFDSLANGQKEAPSRVGLIGIGDSFHYNNGQPGPAPVHPLHSQFWHLDWDGDGRRDLIGFAYRRYEFGNPLEKNMGNAIYFLKNIGTTKQPLFAPRIRLKAGDGAYLQTDLLPQNMFPIDWNDDGHMDFIGTDSRKNLLLWQNTGARDRNNPCLLSQPRVLVALTAVSDFRSQAPGVIRKPTFSIRAINPVDWHGDGGRDLIVSWANTNLLAKVDNTKGVIPYGAPLQVFELLEDIATEKGGAPSYAPPRVITEERGLPLNAACYATGGMAYVDWDGDGDHDLLFQDVTNRPLDGGRLMFSENFGTRREPNFLMPLPILNISDSPQVLDWNDDGLPDLIAGGEFFENINTSKRAVRGKSAGGSRLPRAYAFPQLVSRGPARQVQPEMLGHWAASADWNGDGALDIVRSVASHVQVFINKGTTLNPTFEFGVNLRAGGKDIDLPNWLDLRADPPSDRGPQGMGEAEHSWLNPTVVDFDRDGDLDLFVTSQRWQTMYFENSGARNAAVLSKGREVRYRGNPQEFSWRSKISIGDIDADEVMDMVAHADEDNVFHAYRPAAKQSDPAVLEFDSRQPLMLEDDQPVKGAHTGQNNNGDNHSLLADWDGDGDLDLINGSLRHIHYYENIGTRAKPRFKSHGKLKVDGEDLFVFRHAGSVDAADWNGDGRLDLMVSTENPSDQPMGEIIHLFDRAFIEGELPKAALGDLEMKSAR